VRSVLRWLGDHSQNCAKVARALANASWARRGRRILDRVRSLLDD
jgi:hypothetical protein